MHWLTEEDINGTDPTNERPSSRDPNRDLGLLDDTHSDMDNPKA